MKQDGCFSLSVPGHLPSTKYYSTWCQADCSRLQQTTLVRYWCLARVRCMLWEFSATTDCKPARSMTYFRATILAKIRYCTPAWSGICSASDRARLAHVLRRSKKYGYCADDVPTTAIELFATADQSLFKRVLSNEHHVCSRCCPIRQERERNLFAWKKKLQATVIAKVVGLHGVVRVSVAGGWNQT